MANKYGVPKKQWNKWSKKAQQVFDHVFFSMKQQDLFLHPEATKQSVSHWKTTRWNAAWIAAEAVEDGR